MGDRLYLIVTIAITFVWVGSHVLGWINPEYKAPAGVQGAMMALITAMMSQPLLSKLVVRSKKDDKSNDDRGDDGSGRRGN